MSVTARTMAIFTWLMVMPVVVMSCSSLAGPSLESETQRASPGSSTQQATTASPSSTRVNLTQDAAASATQEGPLPTPTSGEASGLPSGTYVVFSKAESQGGSAGIKDAYYAVPSVGGLPQLLLLLPLESSASVSPSGDTVAHTVSRPNAGGRPELVLLELQTGQTTEVPGSLDCGAPSWSPTGGELALACGSGVKAIYLLTVDGLELTQLTTWQDDYEEQLSPAWSPDGRWIAFLNYIGGQKRDPREGVYLIGTECLATPAACQEATLGPLDCLEWFVWPSDGKAVGCVDGAAVRFIDISTGKQESMMLPSPIAGFAWSPLGDQIAVSLPDSSGGRYIDVFVGDSAASELTQITQGQGDKIVRFWLVVP